MPVYGDAVVNVATHVTIDGGDPFTSTWDTTIDGGVPTSSYTETVDGGAFDDDFAQSGLVGEAPPENYSGGSTATQTHATSGSGFKTAIGSSSVAASHVTSGDGFKTGGGPPELSGGSTATITVTTSGYGFVNTANGSVATNFHSTEGGGQKGIETGDELQVEVSVLGAGERSSRSGHSELEVQANTTGDGSKEAISFENAVAVQTHEVTGSGYISSGGVVAEAGGSTVIVTVEPDFSIGTKKVSGGSTTSQSHTTDGSGAKKVHGGNVSLNSSLTSGNGFKGHNSGNVIEIWHVGTGSGNKSTQGGNVVQVTVSTSGFGGSVIQGPLAANPLVTNIVDVSTRSNVVRRVNIVMISPSRNGTHILGQDSKADILT